MIIVLFGAITILVSIFVWFSISYSPLKSEFEKIYKLLANKERSCGETFSEEILSTKPELLQKYIKYCGLYNQPMMMHSVTVHKDADFLLKKNNPMIKIQYKQANFATICERVAFIATKIGILPFQGLDDNLAGKGRMKGVIGKLFTVFNVQGKEMDQAALVTVLAEGIVCPSFLMNENILWEELDQNHLKATLKQYGIMVSGIFHFTDEGAIVGFYTKDRYMEDNGTMVEGDWKAECRGYKDIDGIKRPTIFKALWVYDEGDMVYFNCDNVNVQFYY